MSARRTRVGLLVLTAAALVAACAGVVTARPQGKGKPPARPEDEKAVDALMAGFVKAFNAGDADAVAALYAEDARVYDDSGEHAEGRAAVRARFAAVFANHPGLTIKTETTSVRFLTDDVAVEEGVAGASLPGDAKPARRNPYTVIYARKNGRWLTAEVRDRAVPGDEGKDGDRALDDLAWLTGDWVDEDDAGHVATSCKKSDDGKFLLRTYKVSVRGKLAAEGVQRVGWDPVRRQVRSWAFDSDGGFNEGFWSRVAPDRWVIKSDGYLRDGRAVSATNTLTRVGPASFRWGSLDRVVGDEALPDVEDVLIVRLPPPPARPATKK